MFKFRMNTNKNLFFVLVCSTIFLGIKLFFEYNMVYDSTFSLTNVFNVIQFSDSPLPALLSLLAFNNFFYLIILSETVYVIFGFLVWKYTKSWIAFLFFQISPLAIGINMYTLGVGYLDDYISMLFMFLAIVSEKRNYMLGKIRLVYIFSVFTLLSHILASLYLLGYFVIKRSWRLTAFFGSLLGVVGFIGVLGYSTKFGQVFTPNLELRPFVVDFQLFYVLSKMFDYTWVINVYFNWIIFISCGLYFVLFKMLKKQKMFYHILPFILLFFVLPFNVGTGPHSLVWRMSWMYIVLFPLLFLLDGDSKHE